MESVLLGEGEAMRSLRREIGLLAPLATTVLVSGETGVGKGLVARELHRRSGRAARRFVHVDCASLAPSVVESELFGHERGAFTGAATRRIGRFERAAGGTVFLDEIGELSPALQAKLLRVLQDREFERLGGAATLPMTARVVAASNRDLRREVREGRFRADLYYRLEVASLLVPPLRARPDDVPLLARARAREAAERLGLPAPVLSDALCARLAAHRWPGNVRELQNVVERLVIRRAGERLGPADLDDALRRDGEPAPEPRPPVGPAPGGDAPARIARALQANDGNVARAARQLGLPRSTLRHRMRRYGLAPSGSAAGASTGAAGSMPASCTQSAGSSRPT